MFSTICTDALLTGPTREEFGGCSCYSVREGSAGSYSYDTLGVQCPNCEGYNSAWDYVWEFNEGYDADQRREAYAGSVNFRWQKAQERVANRTKNGWDKYLPF